MIFLKVTALKSLNIDKFAKTDSAFFFETFTKIALFHRGNRCLNEGFADDRGGFSIGKGKNAEIAAHLRGLLTPSKWKIYQAVKCAHGINQRFHSFHFCLQAAIPIFASLL
ncbi:MAG: hypothetical protein EOM28_03705 [Clostridia bacterium]|nr:hypothetical protein [Clostridia bacterium]